MSVLCRGIAAAVLMSLGCSGSESNAIGGASGSGSGGTSAGFGGEIAGLGGSPRGSGGVSGSASVLGGSSGGGAAGSGSTGGTAGGSAGANAAGTVGVSYPKPCSDVYDGGTLQTFELQISAEQLALLEQDCAQHSKQYRTATFRYGAETAEVGVRLKGNWSYRCDKKQFVISFNETNSEGRFHGLRKIVLDAPWYDPSLLAERLGFSFMRRMGNPWSCVNHARLILNGEYYGVYANVERIDKEYVQRHFPKSEANGNLYEQSELKTNEDTGDTRRRDALLAAKQISEIDALADLEQIVRVWAGSAMLPDPDSYWAGVEINYASYDHPTRGFLWLPMDMDLVMRQGVMDAGTSSVKIGVGMDFVQADPIRYQNPSWGREALYQRVLSDPYWCQRFVEALKVARDAYDVAAMSRDLDTWAAQIESAVLADPRKHYTQQTHLDGVATLKQFMPQRLAFVNEWLKGSRCPVTW